jgi:hypothetical protein
MTNSSAKANLKFFIDEGTYLISEDVMNKRMRAFQKSDRLNKFIKSKLDSNETVKIYIDFEPEPEQNDLVSAWLNRSKENAQILVSLNKAVYETMRKTMPEMRNNGTFTKSSQLNTINSSFSNDVASSDSSDRSDGNHISSTKLIVECFELLKQSNDLKTEVNYLLSYKSSSF